MNGSSGSLETGISGLAFTIAVTSAISVHKTSWVRRLCCSRNIESRILRATPIRRSQEPPMCEACGGLNSHEHPCWFRYLCTVASGWFWLIPSSLHAPMKFVPQSDISCLAGPLMAKKRLKALIQLEVSIDSMTSMWTALELIQQNIIAHRLLSACPPLVRLAVIHQGPKTSNPTYVNGGQV